LDFARSLEKAAVRSSKGESSCSIAQPVPTAETVSLETARHFVRAPVRASVRPVQSISPYLGARTSPALGNAVPSSHTWFRSQVVLPIRDPINSFASESL
jgi:hypothetical protein